MGTRHLIAVQSENEYKIAQYGQWDGYPSGQGLGVLGFLSIPENIKKLKEGLTKTRFIDEEKDKVFIENYNSACPKWSNEPDNRSEEQINWWRNYCSRDLGCEILSNIANSDDNEILLRSNIDFAADSLFCEWAYVIDLDANKFEVYVGFNKVPFLETETHRFSFLPIEKNNEYYHVRMIASFDLNNLPSNDEFLELTETECEEDE